MDIVNNGPYANDVAVYTSNNEIVIEFVYFRPSYPVGEPTYSATQKAQYIPVSVGRVIVPVGKIKNIITTLAHAVTMSEMENNVTYPMLPGASDYYAVSIWDANGNLLCGADASDKDSLFSPRG